MVEKDILEDAGLQLMADVVQEPPLAQCTSDCQCDDGLCQIEVMSDNLGSKVRIEQLETILIKLKKAEGMHRRQTGELSASGLMKSMAYSEAIPGLAANPDCKLRGQRLLRWRIGCSSCHRNHQQLQ